MLPTCGFAHKPPDFYSLSAQDLMCRRAPSKALGCLPMVFHTIRQPAEMVALHNLSSSGPPTSEECDGWAKAHWPKAQIESAARQRASAAGFGARARREREASLLRNAQVASL